MEKTIFLSKSLKKVRKQLLSLNKLEGISVDIINKTNVKITYTGGYNRVYNHVCNCEILSVEKVHNKYNWTFKISSNLHRENYQTDELIDSGSFEDFLINSYIRRIGILQSMDNRLLGTY